MRSEPLRKWKLLKDPRKRTLHSARRARASLKMWALPLKLSFSLFLSPSSNALRVKRVGAFVKRLALGHGLGIDLSQWVRRFLTSKGA